jgi:PAS domain S-box-containing protein
MLPGMDGYQIATLIKANPVTLNIPIIMVTALIDRNARLAGLNAGAEEFLTKPVDRVELQIRVRNLLRLKEYSDLLQSSNALLEQKVQARTVDLQRFRTGMDATNDAIFLVDRTSMHFIEVNSTACTLFDCTHEQLLKMDPTRLDGTTREQLVCAYDAIIAGNADHQPTEFQIPHRNGSALTVEMHRKPIISAGDGLWSACCAIFPHVNWQKPSSTLTVIIWKNWLSSVRRPSPLPRKRLKLPTGRRAPFCQT